MTVVDSCRSYGLSVTGIASSIAARQSLAMFANQRSFKLSL